MQEFIENGGVENEPAGERIRMAGGEVIDLDEVASEIHRLLD